MSALAIQHLTVCYGQQTVIRALNWLLPTAQVHGLVGLNGAGKTTLLNTLFGWEKPQSGTLLLNGVPLTRRDIAYLETHHYFYPHITGNEYLSLFECQSVHFNLTLWQNLFQLPLDAFCENYSTGMKKKLALLALLKADKPVMLLDEPFNGLDLETTELLKLVIERLRAQQKTIIVTSHIMESLTNLCDYLHLLDQGQIVRTATREAFAEFAQALRQRLRDRSDDLLAQVLPSS